ncbi:DUF6701 domain-containing protein [Thalassotalea euphylliae]|uniref:DUF6701 domain-containing protein n=1 Tax=Thalassotalea euphylliae TaxID=1655234 RepID=UPI003636943C
MIRILVVVLVLFVAIQQGVHAAQCDAVFPGDTSLASNAGATIDPSVTCDGGSCLPVPNFEAVTPLPTISPTTVFNNNNLVDGVYEHTAWGMGNGQNVNFGGTGTAVIYFNGSVDISKNTKINDNGSPSNILIVVYGSLIIRQGVDINAHVYVAGSTSIEKNVEFNGSLSSVGGVSVAENVDFTFDSDDVDGIEPHGFCDTSEPPPPLTCDAADTYTVIGRDDFSNPNSWSANNFDRSVSNWPGESIFQSNGEEQNVVFDFSSNRLNVAGSVSAGGDNEYGMVQFPFGAIYDTSSSTNYSVFSSIKSNVNQSTNNDLGIVFGFVDDRNYYLARWTAIGTAYSGSSSFPGTHRALELIKVFGGVATTLDSIDESETTASNNFSMQVVVTEDGTGVCVGNSAGNNMVLELYSAETPVLNNVGLYSYDNDIGIEFDDFLVRCLDCEATAGSFYRFEDADFSGGIENIYSGFDAINIGGVPIPDGKYCQGFSPNGFNLSSTTGNAFNSQGSPNSQAGTINFWFRSEVNWANGTDRVLFDASTYTSFFGSRFSDNFTLELLADGRLQFEMNSTFFTIFVDEYTLTEPFQSRQAGVWYFISLVWEHDADIYKIYVDGSEVVSNTQSVDFFPNSAPLHFGDNASLAAGSGSYPSPNSARGDFDEVRIYDEVRSEAQIIADRDESFDCSTSPLFVLEHDGSGLTCLPEPVTVFACSDANCTTPDTSITTTMDLLVNGVSQQVSIVNGVGTPQPTFNYTDTVNNAVLSSSSDYTCRNTGTGEFGTSGTACEVDFDRTAFVFSTIGNQTAGEAFSGHTLEAVADVDGVCTALINGNADIEFAVQYQTPSDVATANTYTIKDTNGAVKNIPKNIGSPVSYEVVNLSFDANGVATLDDNIYNDAGEITLHARYTTPAQPNLPSVNIDGNSNNFWVKPYELVMTAYKSSNLSVLLNASTIEDVTSSTAFHPAGDDFTLHVSALNKDGDLTTNYEQTNLQLKVLRAAPLDISGATPTTFYDGVFTDNAGATISSVNGASPGTFEDVTLADFDPRGSLPGQSISNNVSYSEIALLALEIRDFDYGNQPNFIVDGSSASVGRFIPSYLEQSVASIGNLVARDNETNPAATCGPRDWVYSGQLNKEDYDDDPDDIPHIGAIRYEENNAPRLKISAHDADGNQLLNYLADAVDSAGTSFNRLALGDVVLTPPSADLTNATYLIDAISLLDTANARFEDDDENTIRELHYVLSPDDHFTYQHIEATKVSPFTAQFVMAIDRIEDQDGIFVDTTNISRYEDLTIFEDDPATTEIDGSTLEVRFGRLVIENSYGSETAQLEQPMRVEYFDNDNWLINEDDVCTEILSTEPPWEFNDISGGLTETNISPPTTYVGATEFMDGGTYNEVLIQSNAPGSIGVTFNTVPWLQFDWNGDNDGVHDDNANAIATFGRFRGNDRIIYWREVNN